MANDRRTLRALAALLPAGALGLSMSLAAADAKAARSAGADRPEPASVSQRLQSIRDTVSVVVKEAAKDADDPTADRDIQLAWWGNGGWHNGGWRNGGWLNGWHNGGWHNWGNGWHNGGWLNGWHNW
jgi:rSAM-associated Gly-rich repeat protein